MQYLWDGTEGLTTVPCLNICLPCNIYHVKEGTCGIFQQLKKVKWSASAGVTLFSVTCITATMVHLQVMLSALCMNKNL